MTEAQIEALTIEQDEIMVSMHNMKKNAHMYSSGTTLFHSLRRLENRYNEIQRLLDEA